MNLTHKVFFAESWGHAQATKLASFARGGKPVVPLPASLREFVLDFANEVHARVNDIVITFLLPREGHNELLTDILRAPHHEVCGVPFGYTHVKGKLVLVRLVDSLLGQLKKAVHVGRLYLDDTTI